jgi:hypothetical protein
MTAMSLGRTPRLPTCSRMEIVLGVQEGAGKLFLKFEQFLPRIVLVRFFSHIRYPATGQAAGRTVKTFSERLTRE